MAQSRARRPLSTAEAAMATLLAYLILLISLAAARLFDADDAAVQGLRPVVASRAAAVAPRTAAVAPRTAAGAPRTAAVAPRTAAVAPRTATVGHRTAATAPGSATLAPTTAAVAPRPVERLAAGGSCVGPSTVPYSYASAPGVAEPLAFGPPVEQSGPLSTAAVNGVLIQRLCGGPEVPGGPVRAPDRRLYAAIDAAVNGTDPNRSLTRDQWANGVDQLISRDGRFVDASVETRTVRASTATFGMQARGRGADPLVLRTRLAHDDTSRYLLLPVQARDGRTVTLTLRLRCGFQPVL